MTSCHTNIVRWTLCAAQLTMSYSVALKKKTPFILQEKEKKKHLFVNIALKTRLKYTDWTEKTFYTVKKTSYIESMPCTYRCQNQQQQTANFILFRKLLTHKSQSLYKQKSSTLDLGKDVF